MQSLVSLLKTYSWIRLIAETCISAAITAALLAGLWFGAGALEFLILFVPPLYGLLIILGVTPFIAVPLVGVIVTGRPGFVIGPILIAAAVYGFISQTMKQRHDFFAALTSVTSAPVRADHKLLAIEDFADSDRCFETCIKVLATSDHTVAQKKNLDRDDSWFLYTRAEGPPCFLRENAKLALDFLLHGFPGICATVKRVADFDDGNFLRVQGIWKPLSFPSGFIGNSYEHFERIDGQDRLLARYIKGSFPPTRESLFLTSAIDAGPPIDNASFFANALGIDVDALGKPVDPFPFDEVLTEIEKYLDLKETIGARALRDAGFAWRQIAANAAQRQPELARARILRFFATHDAFRTELGIGVMWLLPPGERTYPDDVVLDLMFVPIDGQASLLLQKELERQFATARPPAPSDIRERAKAHLSDPDLAPWKLRILSQLSDTR